MTTKDKRRKGDSHVKTDTDRRAEAQARYAADKKNSDGSNKSFYGTGIRGMDGETAIRLFQEGAKR